MHPILFHVGSFEVRAYSLAVATALFAAGYFAAWLGRRRGLPWAEQCVDFIPWAGLSGLVGSRIWEVAFNWSYYRSVPAEIPAVWHGGVSIQGAVLGGLIAALLFCRAQRIPFGRFADEVVPALLLGQAIGRLLGCTMNGDAYGKPTGTPWGIVHAPGTNAHAAFGAQPLWPAEVFEGLFDLLLMALFIRLGINRGPAGRHFLLYGLLYSTGRFFLEFMRADTEPWLGGLTAAQAGSLSAIGLVSCGLVWQLLRQRSQSPWSPGQS